jgi:hypothetical protein
MNDLGCFLCEPDSDLLVARVGAAYAMVGLGPITSTYAILATSIHAKSLADIARSDSEAVADFAALRSRLESVRGPLLMTEHGRVPICRDDGDQHEAHCFHAHSLIFGLDKSILAEAKQYYSDSESYPDLLSALEAAANEDSYLLLSERSGHYHVLSGPLNTPRQLTRYLVAFKAEQGHLADWRSDPRRTAALQMADELRTALARYK